MQLPSEHTQEGKRYDVEMQMYHFYSVTAEEAGVPNQMGTVSIFMQAYDDAEDYDVLNKLICQWRRVEQETREQCGLSRVSSSYSGCGGSRNRDSVFDFAESGNRYLRTGTKAHSIHDVLTDKLERALSDPSIYEPMVMENTEETEGSETEWEEYINSVHLLHEAQRQRRHLADYENVPWTNYFGLMDVKTEYYFRYSG